jgi:hypothetical protein
LRALNGGKMRASRVACDDYLTTRRRTFGTWPRHAVCAAGRLGQRVADWDPCSAANWPLSVTRASPSAPEPRFCSVMRLLQAGDFEVVDAAGEVRSPG